VEVVAPDAPTHAVKAVSEDDGALTVGGYLVMWGSPTEKDLQGEYFTKSTQLWTDRYPTVPTLFHHGLDSTIGLSVVGHRTKAAADDVGMWVEDVIDKSNSYWVYVDALVKAGKLHYSPGSAPHLVKSTSDGELLSFPVVEDTLTPTPAQPRLRPIEQIRAAYKSANIDIELPDPEEEADAGASEAERLRLLVEAEILLTETT